MRMIKAQPLNLHSFRKYGEYVDLFSQDFVSIGEPPVEFFRDILQQPLNTQAAVSISTCLIQHRELTLDELEMHSHTGEGSLSLDGDILLTVAPATTSGEPDVNAIEVYQVPKGTYVSIRPGVWHCAAFASNRKSVHVMIVLPERAYANDCIKVKTTDLVRIE